MQINGKQAPLPKEISVNEFLEKEGYDPQRVAVEKNGSIIPRKSFGAEMLSDADKIEIVHFVGGG
ncbi:MAG: sulfur carrier protein ThiS [Treponema sp.]|jgi:sulfur carrier protein|nr:sulfur carrier protein ThiS [Treponema sp.]